MGVKDWCRHATELSVMTEVMLTPIYGDGRLFEQAKPECIGPPFSLTPDAAWNNRFPGAAFREVLIADCIEYDPIGVSKRYEKVGAGDLRVEIVHLGQRQAPEHCIAFAPLSHLSKRDDRVTRQRAWSESIVTAPLPTLGHRCRQGTCGKAMATLKRTARAFCPGKLLHVSSFMYFARMESDHSRRKPEFVNVQKVNSADGWSSIT